MERTQRLSKEVRARGERWQVRCPECDAWHGVVVQVQARLAIRPGLGVRTAWEREDAVIACAMCHESVDFLFTPEWREAVLKAAESTV